jgi:hypothetical protein
MVNKLYVLKCSSLRKIYKTHYFLCLGERKFSTTWVLWNSLWISSGTLVDSAIWKVGYDIEEVEVSESNQILDSVLKKRTKDFITRLSLKKIWYDNLQYKIFFYIILFLEINNC